jgi:pyruvate/oxaloacetate carboxyltransferase
MKKIQFTETILRDANQSLIATRLPYDRFADILPVLDECGFYSVECWGGATFDSCLRYLDEDPWERLRKIKQAMPKTKLQMLLRGQNILGYKHYPTTWSVIRRVRRQRRHRYHPYFDARTTPEPEGRDRGDRQARALALGGISYTTSPCTRWICS